MTEPAEEDQVALPAPASAGEPLAAYIKRAIVEDPILVDLERQSRAFPFQFFLGGTQSFRPTHTLHSPDVSAFPVAVSTHFAPAQFSLAEVVARHDGLDRVRLGVSQRTANRLDEIWHRNGPPLLVCPPGRGPLDVLMAAQPRYDLGDDLPQATRLAPLPTPGAGRRDDQPRDFYLIELEAQVLKNWRAAARRRDVLVASLCDAWRSRAIDLRGFRAGDFKRRIVEIPVAWLFDPWLSCWWQQDELRPLDGAPGGTPHFRGLAACPGSKRTASVAQGRRKRCASPIDIEPEFLAWAKNEYVTKEDAEAWAKKRGFPIRVVRILRTKHFGQKRDAIAGAKWAQTRS